VPAFILGLLLGNGWPDYRVPALLVCLVLLCWLTWCLRRHRNTRFLPLLLWCALGYLSLQPWLAPRLAANHVSTFADGGVCSVAGMVVDTPQRYGERYRCRVQVASLGDGKGGTLQPTRGDLRLTWAVGQGALGRGDQIRFTARLRRMRSFHNPGGFDYARYMGFQGLRVSAYARRDSLEILVPADPPGPLARFLKSRLGAAAQAVAAAGAQSQRAAVTPLLETLLMGQRQGLTPEIREPFNRCGVAHLLAISGLHLGAVGAFAFVVFTALLAFVPALRWRGWVGRTAATLSLGPVLIYALLAGLPVSTQRAAVMIAVLMVAILIQRRSDAFNTLALAALVVLIGHPPALFAISFQLSFVAVTAILYGLKCSGEWWRRGPPGPLRLRQRLRLLLLISTLAFVGTAPLVSHYFNTLSLVALPVNLLLVPWVSFLILPMGLLGLLLALLALPGSGLLLVWCAHHLTLVDTLVAWISRLEWAAVDTITPSNLELLLGYGLLTLLPLVNRSRRARRATLIVVLLMGADGAYWGYQRYANPHLRITAIDVGQGGSTLVELPGGKTLLIDGGGFSDNRIFDVGRRVLTPLLGRKKIRTLDLVALSHPNSDHLNGLLYLLEHFKVGQLWRNADAPATVGFKTLLQTLAAEEIEAPRFEDLPRRLQLGATVLQLLHPPEAYSKQPSEGRLNTNDNSLVLKLTYGRHSFLWPGDLERRAEAELVASHPPGTLATTVLFAPHHGSRSSSSPAWVAAVSPEEVIFSVGWQNPYHFPHPDVAASYRAQGARLWRTDSQGAVAFNSDGHRLRISSELPAGP
jgi:competence protein ComEC